MRKWPVLLLAVAVVLAGCGQFVGGPERTPTDVPDEGDVTPEVDTADSADGETDSTPTPQYSTSLDTGNILLTLSELSDGYTVEGETLRYRNRTSGETYNRMQEREVKLLHERAFSTNATGEPELVFASVAVYDSPAATQSWLDSHLGAIRESEGSVEERQVAGTSATVARFQSSNDLQTIAVYERRANVVFYIAASDEEYQNGSAEELFATVVNEFDNS